MDRHLKKLIEIAGEAVGAKDVTPGGDLCIKIGYTEWKQLKPFIFQYNFSVDLNQEPKSVREYLDEFKKLGIPFQNVNTFKDKFLARLEASSDTEPVRVPFLVFSKGDKVVPNVMESQFEIKNPPESLTRMYSGGVDEISTFYLGFPGCPVRFDPEITTGFEEGTNNGAMVVINFGYPNVLCGVKDKFIDLVKQVVLDQLGWKTTHKDKCFQEIIDQERLFISPKIFEDWTYPPITVACIQPLATGIMNREGVIWGVSSGWNLFQTLNKVNPSPHPGLE